MLFRRVWPLLCSATVIVIISIVAIDCVLTQPVLADSKSSYHSEVNVADVPSPPATALESKPIFKHSGMMAAELLHFDGYVTLPRRARTLSILDYIAIFNGTAYVGGVSTSNVSTVSLDTIHLSRHKTTHEAGEISGLAKVHGIAVVPALQLAFVTNSGDNTVAVIDLRTQSIVDRIRVAENPDALLFDSRTGLIYVVNGTAKLATLIDPKARSVVATIALGGEGESPVLDPRTGLLYQSIGNTGEVVVVDLAGQTIVERWTIGRCPNPTGLAIDSPNHRLFAGCTKGSLAVIDMNTHATIASLPIGKWPDTIAYDALSHRIYTTGGLGRLVIIEQQDADHYAVREWISTHYGAHTLTVDPTSHKVYLACLGFFGHPRLAVFSPKDIHQP